MSAEVVYRSSHPDVLAAWAETQHRYREWHEKVGAFAADFPDHKPVVRNFGDAVECPGLRGDESPGKGWRYVSRIDAWVPDKRLKAGKGWAEVLSTLKVNSLGRVPGMPHDVIVDGGRWISCGMREHDGVVWASWSHDPDKGRPMGRTSIDHGMWERGRLSEYFAAIEAAAPTPVPEGSETGGQG